MKKAVLLILMATLAHADLIDDAINALVMVESGGRKNPPAGDSGRAVGILQMWPIAVDEANRLAGTNRWTYADRHDPAASREMCRVTLKWHQNRGVTNLVDLASRWRNPRGDAPEWYRERIRQAFF